MKVLVVDDERLARAELRRLLREHPEIEIVGDAADVAEAVAKVKDISPDLLFLDVEMPSGTGFDVLERLEDVPSVIFTTAFESYAVRAFQVSAVDYLLKPIEPSRLAASLERVRVQVKAREAKGRAPMERLFVRDGPLCMLVELADVRLLESEGNYARLHLEGKQPLLLRSLNYLEGRLDPEQFVRANRRQLVNLRWVQGVEPGPAGSLVLTLNGGGQVEMSRRQSAELRRRLEP